MSLSSTQIEGAASLLIEARRTGHRLASLPGPVRPASIAEAHAVQDAVLRYSGRPVGAIKVNAPKTGGVFRGMLEDAACHASPAMLEISEGDYAGIEAEIAFRFPDGLAPSPSGYRAEAVADAVLAFAAFDIVGTRFEDFMARTQFERIADGLNAGAFVYGKDNADWRAIDYADIPVSIWIDGVEVFTGIGGHPSVDPFAPVLAYVETVRDGGLPAGTMLTTGSFCGLLPIARGQIIRAVLGPFDPIVVTLSPSRDTSNQSE